MTEPAWDGVTGTAGGPAFAAALAAAIDGLDMDVDGFAAAAHEDPTAVAAVLAGERRISVAVLARYATALRKRPIAFLQATALLSHETYALGLDPLYFIPPGTTRHDARIYMREINPRHAVPERDMFVRNPALKALLDDPILDDLGKLELELAYLLRAAVQSTGGTL